MSVVRKLDGKVAVITGASRGLGEAMAVGFARQGAAVVLAARTSRDLDRVAAACQDAGAPAVRTRRTDVKVSRQVRDLVGVVDSLGGVDVFVANAAASVPNLTDKRPTTLDTYEYALAEELMRVNCLGVWLSMKMALPVMTTGGSFIAIGPGFTAPPGAGGGLFAVSKASVGVLVRIAAAEVAPRGIRVNELAPGQMVDTNLFGPHKMPEQLKHRVPWATPQIIVPAAVWLASDDSVGVTGASLAATDFNSRSPEQARALLGASPANGETTPPT